MTDDQIAGAVARQLGVALLLVMIGRREKAQLFMQHSLRLMATHRDAIQRWLDIKDGSKDGTHKTA